jgi:hypothetical protein
VKPVEEKPDEDWLVLVCATVIGSLENTGVPKPSMASAASSNFSAARRYTSASSLNCLPLTVLLAIAATSQLFVHESYLVAYGPAMSFYPLPSIASDKWCMVKCSQVFLRQLDQSPNWWLEVSRASDIWVSLALRITFQTGSKRFESAKRSKAV